MNQSVEHRTKTIVIFFSAWVTVLEKADLSLVSVFGDHFTPLVHHRSLA